MSVYSVDGVDLDAAGGRWFVEFATNAPVPAVRRVSDLDIPRRDGVITVEQGWGVGSVKISLVVTDRLAPVDENWSALSSVLVRARVLSRHMSDGTVRRVGVVRTVVSEPVRADPRTWRVQVQFEVQPFWQEGSPVTDTVKPLEGTQTFARWAGTTGDVVDGIIRVKGPFTILNLTIGGRAFAVQRATTSTEYLFIEPVEFRAWVGGSAAWTPTSSRVLIDYANTGVPKLTPTEDGLVIQVLAPGSTTSSSLTVRGSRFWV